MKCHAAENLGALFSYLQSFLAVRANMTKLGEKIGRIKSFLAFFLWNSGITFCIAALVLEETSLRPSCIGRDF